MPRDYLAQGEDESLRRLCEALVGWFLNDAKCFEMNPHRMSRVGEPPMSVGICRQKVAEFIVDDWFGDRQDREQGGSQCQSEQSNSGNRLRSMACHLAESALELLKPV